MRKRGFLVFGVAVVFAVAAVFLARNWLTTKSVEAYKKNMPTATVVVASSALDFGAILKKENLKVIRWPSKNLPKNSFKTLDELVKKGTSRVVLRRIEANEPVLSSKVSGFGGRASLSTIISDEMRASTIRVNDVNGVAGFVLPGDRVDVMITRSVEAGGKNNRRSKNLITDLLLQNVKVLATDQNASEDKEKPSVAKAVTLEVTPRQAQKLVLAQKVGSLSLALRNVKNGSSAATYTVSINDLRVGEINDKAPVKTTAKKGAKRNVVRKSGSSRLSSVKVYRGVTASSYRVPKEHGRVSLPTSLLPDRSKQGQVKSGTRSVEVPDVTTDKVSTPAVGVPVAPVSLAPSTAPNLAAR